MILAQHYLLWLGSFPTLTKNQANDFDSAGSFAQRMIVAPVIAWDFDEESGTMTAITTNGKVSPDSSVGHLGPSRHDVESSTRTEALSYFYRVKSKH